jgi:hypothetical protein
MSRQPLVQSVKKGLHCIGSLDRLPIAFKPPAMERDREEEYT